MPGIYSSAIKLTALAGLLVLLGAGCAKPTPSSAPSQDSQANKTQQAEDGSAKPQDFSARSVCLNGFDSYDDFLGELKKFQIEIRSESVFDKVSDDFENGWTIHKACFTNALEVSQMKFAFVLTKTSGVTADEAKSVVRAVSFKDQKLKPEDFKGEFGWSLMKFRYFGTPDANGNGGFGSAESKFFAVNGGPNQSGYLENLSFVRDVQDAQQNVFLKAQTAGGDNDSYYADVEYRPKGKQGLTFKICTNINYGKELGQDMRFTCQK